MMPRNGQKALHVVMLSYLTSTDYMGLTVCLTNLIGYFRLIKEKKIEISATQPVPYEIYAERQWLK